MKKEIIKNEEQLRLAMLNNDLEILDKLIDESLVFITPNGTIATKKADLEIHKNKLQKLDELNLLEQKIDFKDNLSIVTALMQIKGSFAQMDISGNYRYLRIWQRQENNWKIIAGSVTQIK